MNTNSFNYRKFKDYVDQHNLKVCFATRIMDYGPHRSNRYWVQFILMRELLPTDKNTKFGGIAVVSSKRGYKTAVEAHNYLLAFLRHYRDTVPLHYLGMLEPKQSTVYRSTLESMKVLYTLPAKKKAGNI